MRLALYLLSICIYLPHDDNLPSPGRGTGFVRRAIQYTGDADGEQMIYPLRRPISHCALTLHLFMLQCVTLILRLYEFIPTVRDYANAL